MARTTPTKALEETEGGAEKNTQKEKHTTRKTPADKNTISKEDRHIDIRKIQGEPDKYIKLHQHVCTDHQSPDGPTLATPWPLDGSP